MSQDSRPFIVFGVARSGTTPVYDVVSHYAKLRFGQIPLGEYFNLVNHEPREIEGRIEMVPRHPLEPLGYAESIRVLNERMDLLLKHWGRYSLKLIPMNFFPRHSNRILRESRWILVERKDLFETMLSWLVSITLNRWYLAEPTMVQEPFRVDLENVDRFVASWRAYQHVKELLPNSQVIFYEDTLKDGRVDAERIYALLGWGKPGNESIRIIHKQNLFDKRAALINITDVEEAYRASPLQAVFPI